MRNSLLATFAVVLAGAASSAVADNGLEPPMDLLASQIRDQGFKCDKPQNAKFDASQSKPNEKVWVLQCENDTFRMTVIPNMAAKIEKIGQ
ncbi:hypothetical protein [Hyphomicrobium sp.]|uniref:hypothetical protein n=1 Tax=Hyphomicrobium sp. TaxID=82 RepID=UPI000FA755A3|nr:hypothetical protein [Hyphomicrobium sp.]RUO99533.1 MAG: hypothetical protein EKK30_06475 [Hyphomicrobium sp.]